MKRFYQYLMAAMTVAQLTIQAAEPASEDPLALLKPYLGIWKGHFKNSTPEKPVIDIAHWERALNGKAVRILHSINDGVYGGETLILWDKEKRGLVYEYFTTAGFRTSGTAQVEEGRLICHERVSGNADGITEVKATVRLKPEGTLTTTSEYFKNGSWVPGHEVKYQKAPEAKVIFK